MLSNKKHTASQVRQLLLRIKAIDVLCKSKLEPRPFPGSSDLAKNTSQSIVTGIASVGVETKNKETAPKPPTDLESMIIRNLAGAPGLNSKYIERTASFFKDSYVVVQLGGEEENTEQLTLNTYSCRCLL